MYRNLPRSQPASFQDVSLELVVRVGPRWTASSFNIHLIIQENISYNNLSRSTCYRRRLNSSIFLKKVPYQRLLPHKSTGFTSCLLFFIVAMVPITERDEANVLVTGMGVSQCYCRLVSSLYRSYIDGLSAAFHGVRRQCIISDREFVALDDVSQQQQRVEASPN